MSYFGLIVLLLSVASLICVAFAGLFLHLLIKYRNDKIGEGLAFCMFVSVILAGVCVGIAVKEIKDERERNISVDVKSRER